MSLVRAFTGLRPTSDHVSAVVAPPYDVMSTAEAREMVAGRPWSFLHISRPEVDLPEGIDPYSPEVYAKAAENLQHMQQQVVLRQEREPSLYVYRLTMGEHTQTGLVAVASVEAYDSERIKRHEFTKPTKEDDRVQQIDALNAQTGPVFMVYPSDLEVDTLLAAETGREPDMDVMATDGVRHEIWVVTDKARIATIIGAFDAMPSLYIADGHHRSAAASRVAASRREANPGHTGSEPYNYFLSVIFPHKQMQILDYNRVVRDLNGLQPDELLQKIGGCFTVEPSSVAVKPEGAAEFGMYLQGQWYRLRLDPARIPTDDPVATLDISLLSNELIDPILGIADQRRDERIDFVGGIRGLQELERRVDSGSMAVAFSLYPTSMEALMAVADVGEVMPPKSTWFEPKLADGLVSHLL